MQLQPKTPRAWAVGGTGSRPPDPVAVRRHACRTLLHELFGTPARRVAVARRWLFTWLEHQQHQDVPGPRVLCELLYHVLVCPVQIELTAYESSSNAAHSISLQLLGPVDHGSPRLFGVLVGAQSSVRLRWLCLMQLMMHQQDYFGEVGLNTGLCPGALYRRCLFDPEAERGVDRIALCIAIFQLFLLGGLYEESYQQAMETAQCAIRYLRERIEARGSSLGVMQRAHQMCLDLELRMDDLTGVLLWLAEFVASYAYEGEEDEASTSGEPGPPPPPDPI